MRMTTALLLTALLADPGLAQDQPAPPAEKPAPAQPAEDNRQDAPTKPDADADANADATEQEADPMDELAKVSVEELVQSLNDPRFAVREAATALLLADTQISAQTLEPFITAETPQETVERLLLISKHHLVSSIRVEVEKELPQVDAGIGFSHMAVLPDENPYSDNAGTRITRTMPGFPGYVYLKPGDIILEIDGRSASTRNEAFIQHWVSTSVTRRAPGDNITLLIGRNGKTHEMTFATASVAALSRMYNPNLVPMYERRWQATREQLLKDRKPAKSLVPQDAE